MILLWLQGLTRQPLANTGAWLSAPLPPEPPRAQCTPPASSNLTHGASLCPGCPQATGGAASFSALGEFQAGILYLLESPLPLGQLKEAQPLGWDQHQQQSLETEKV